MAQAFDTKKFKGELKVDLNKYLEPQETGILVIDMENDTTREGGYLEFWNLIDTAKKLNTVENIKKLVAVCHQASIKVFWFKYRFLKGYKDVSKEGWLQEFVKHIHETMGPHSLEEGQDGIEIIDALAQQIDEEKDFVISKHETSCFPGTELEMYLTRFGIRTVIVTGVNTDCCVESTVRDLRDMGYLAVVPGDACATVNLERHRLSLERFKLPWFFAEVVSTDELIKVIKNKM